MRKWSFANAQDKADEPVLNTLVTAMNDFYNKQAISQNYWLEADENNKSWNTDEHPYHLRLRSYIKEGDKVADFGCGSAHAYLNLRDKKIYYTGIEWSEAQVEINRKKYPETCFEKGDITKAIIENADWAISFFVLEHCVKPDQLLIQMKNSLKIGGHLCIICPDFQYGMNSIRTGFRATSKRDKLKKFQLVDFCMSLFDEKIRIPQRVKKIHDSDILFPIYLKPRCLNAPYFSDNDAVFLTNKSKIAGFLKSIGMQIFLDNSQEKSEQIFIIAKRVL